LKNIIHAYKIPNGVFFLSIDMGPEGRLEIGPGANAIRVDEMPHYRSFGVYPVQVNERGNVCGHGAAY
jgi:hypothetical protein